MVRWLANFVGVCYTGLGATSYGRRLAPPFGGDFFAPSDFVEGGDAMVTYSELFSYSLVIIGVIGLVIQITKKK